MKKKIIAYSLIPALGLAIAVAAPMAVGAHGFGGLGFGFFGGKALTPDEIASQQQAAFQNTATMLGIPLDDVKKSWAEGKGIVEIAEKHGITKEQLKQKKQDAALVKLKSHLETLVEKGVITQAQADSRLQFMQSNQGKFGGRMKMKMMRPF